MADSEPKPFSTPPSRRFLFWRQRYAPVVVWAIAVTMTLALTQQRTVYVQAPAIAEARAVAVAPVEEGIIQGIRVTLFENVEAGQVVALMDDDLFRTEKSVAEAEFARLRDEVVAARASLLLEVGEQQRDLIDTQRRFAFDEEEARLDLLDRVVAQESNKIRLESLALTYSRQNELLSEKIGDQAAYDEARLRHGAAKVELRENEAAIAAARAHLEETSRRRQALPASIGDVDLDELLGPLREALNVQNAAVEALAARGERLLLKAPITGQVSQVLSLAGETVLAGEPLLTITGSKPDHVLAYVPETAARNIQPGVHAELSTRDNPRKIYVAEVMQTSVRIEALPSRLQRNPMLAEWGRPVLIGAIPSDAFIPGEVLDVRFLSPTSGQ